MNLDKVGNFIKELRLNHHYTQKQFADLLGVTSQAVSKWERGLAIPDIMILKEISEKFQVNINEILGEEKKKKPKRKNYLLYIVILFLVLFGLSIGLYFYKSSQNFEFKTISTTCKEFEINGSAAYNKDKTSIYISNIEYCGKENKMIYKNLSCKLYSGKSLITTCKRKSNITIEEYLKDLKMKVSNHKTCKNIKENKLILKIYAEGDNDFITTYQIPLELKENC